MQQGAITPSTDDPRQQPQPATAHKKNIGLLRLLDSFEDFLEINIVANDQKAFKIWRSYIRKTLNRLEQKIKSAFPGVCLSSSEEARSIDFAELSSAHRGSRRVAQFRFRQKLYIGLRSLEDRLRTISLNSPVSEYFEGVFEVWNEQTGGRTRSSVNLLIYLVKSEDLFLSKNVSEIERENSTISAKSKSRVWSFGERLQRAFCVKRPDFESRAYFSAGLKRVKNC